MNISTSVKKRIPHAIKHPLIVGTNWIWKARSLPAQSLKDISIFKDVLSNVGGNKIRILEWGSGNSTFFYPEYLLSIGRDFSWHAIENSTEWFEICTAKLTESQLEEYIQIDCFEFPPFWELAGYSPDPSLLAAVYDDNQNVERYINQPRDLGIKFDLIFIDGRFRRRCLLTALDVLDPGGLVILHDAQKAHYHSSLTGLTHVEFLETGNLPGTSQRSTIAVCALEDNACLDHIRGKYRSHIISPNSISNR